MQDKLNTVKPGKENFHASTIEGICPFIEEPSVDRFPDNPFSQPGDIDADILFSFFTADIINEKVVFTR